MKATNKSRRAARAGAAGSNRITATGHGAAAGGGGGGVGGGAGGAASPSLSRSNSARRKKRAKKKTKKGEQPNATTEAQSTGNRLALPLGTVSDVESAFDDDNSANDDADSGYHIVFLIGDVKPFVKPPLSLRPGSAPAALHHVRSIPKPNFCRCPHVFTNVYCLFSPSIDLIFFIWLYIWVFFLFFFCGGRFRPGC